MRVQNIMTQRPVCTRPEATLTEAAARMRDLDVGSLPVCGEDDQLAGMLTDRDITIRAVAEGFDPRVVTVREAMTPEVSYCFEEQEVAEAARVMKEKQIRRLPVLNREKRLVGILSLGDVAVQTGDDKLAGNTLEAISEPVR